MAEYETGPRWRTRTVSGVTLSKLAPTEDGTAQGWEGVIAGETWRFYKKADRKWQGYTADHLTGSARSFSLRRLVTWVVEHQAEWAEKLAVRRAKGRMHDPLTKAG